MTIKIVWPTRRVLTDDEVLTMYGDACENNQIAMKVTGRLDTPEAHYAMALALDDAGLITMADPNEGNDLGG